jgi:hypothetical protein
LLISFLGVGKLILAGPPLDIGEKFIGGIVDTSEQFFVVVVDTSDKFKAFWLFLTGINDTREKCYRRCQQHRR